MKTYNIFQSLVMSKTGGINGGHHHDIQKENCAWHYSASSYKLGIFSIQTVSPAAWTRLGAANGYVNSANATLTTFPIENRSLNVTATGIPPTATATPQPLCGGPAVMNFLAVGSDTRGQHYLYGLADIIRLVRVDFVNSRVTILEVPRDLWVEIPGISDHYNITHGKLNQSYLYGNKGLGYYDGPGEGPGLLARTLNLNFGAQPDHYIAVNMLTFEAIVDAIGGIDVYLPYEISVKSKDNPKGFGIPAGQHHIDGETALWVARIRQYTTFGRAENQNIVMCALRKKLLSPAIVPAIPQLVKDFQRYVQTDLSAQQINQLACLATQMHGTDVIFASFPMELFKVRKHMIRRSGRLHQQSMRISTF